MYGSSDDSCDEAGDGQTILSTQQVDMGRQQQDNRVGLVVEDVISDDQNQQINDVAEHSKKPVQVKAANNLNQ